MDPTLKAFKYAEFHHRGQKRKYTGEDYWEHPYAVASMLIEHMEEFSAAKITNDMICAAFMHDLIEDTAITYCDIDNHFGESIADLVRELTDVTTLTDGNRHTRKEIERKRLAEVSDAAKTIKLADLIDNSKSIIEHDPKFAKVFMQEMLSLVVSSLAGGDGILRTRALWICNEYDKNTNQPARI